MVWVIIPYRFSTSVRHFSYGNPDQHPATPLRQNSIYLLPNSFTIAALFSAFYAITQSMHGRYETAAIAVFISMLLDGMDGRVARLTNSQSAFGEQLDSLADMVSFGVAPRLLPTNGSFGSSAKSVIPSPSSTAPAPPYASRCSTRSSARWTNAGLSAYPVRLPPR